MKHSFRPMAERQGDRLLLLAVLAAVTAIGCSRDGAFDSKGNHDTPDDVRRAAALLDYVATDYAAAVEDGQVVDDLEYREQIEFVREARERVALLPPAAARDSILSDLERTQGLIETKAPAEQVSVVCRAAGKSLLAAYGVVLAPIAPPSYERGAELFQGHCVQCHGAAGAGDGPAAASLNPRPRSFLDREVMKDLSPGRAFNAITDGVMGTGMPSFQALSATDRWSLAFYLFTLRIEARDLGAEALASKILVNQPRLEFLAGVTDGELVEQFEPFRSSRNEVQAAVAHLRRVAPFSTTGTRLGPAIRGLRAAVAAYAAGDASRSIQILTGAYLEGFEPHEPALRAHAPDMVENIEEAFLGLREQGRSSVSVERFAQDARTLENMLIEAEAVLGSPSGWRIPFVASLLILLRESLESALLVLLLLGLARRAGAARDVGAVHAGWSAAVIAGLITWLATGAIIAMSGASRELVEGVISLTAAVVLVYASHFVLARLDAKRRIEALRERFRSASPAQRYWVLFLLGFVAVYREVFEVVLFLRALLVEAPEARRFVALGSAAGLASSGLVIFALRTLGRRMNPGMVLGGSGALLCGLAVILTGKGIHALQEAGFVGVSRIGVPRIEWLGLYPTLQTVAAQTLTVAIIVVVAAGGTHALRRAAETGVAP